MTPEKMIETVDLYERLFISADILKVNWPHDKLVFGEHPVEHCYGMLDEMRQFIASEKYDKFYRWLGFIQGILWAKGFYTLEELKNHNRG